MSNEMHKSISAQEQDVLNYWDEHQCFEKSIEQRPEGKPYVFYDGPPFATGLPHYGHIVASVMKDVVPRYWTMKGYRVSRTWGWDCHGLPIENIVEKKFDLGTKKDIEDFGIERFNSACGSEVLLYANEWQGVIRRIGRWVDMKHAYHTMDTTYMESSWWVFKQLFDKGLIYEGRKPMHICPRCETALSNFEVNQGYADVKDISAYALFRLTSGAYEGVQMIAWTTTPWTLPGNVLIAVHPDLAYVLVEDGEGQKFIVQKDRIQHTFEGKNVKVVEEFVGTDLIGSTYEPLFPYFADHENAFRVVGADFVTTEDGTGLVHIAPGFGEDDKNLGEAEKVAPIMHVMMNGQFVPEVAEPLQEEGYEVLGVPVKKKDDSMSVDIEIIKWLAHHGKLFRKEKLEHSYPLCWRCDTPLLNYGTSSWFVRVTDIKDQLVASNKEINWTPENMKEGRFGKWLEGARDWAISRSRFWGTPLPLWRSEDGEMICVGSVEELKDLSGVQDIEDLHKHTIDKITIEKDGKTFTRIPEVLDCWFESGAMPYAQLHYPFENKEVFERGFPAEFIAEGQDQTRGWFYTLHILSNALFNMPAFKNVVVNGIVLAEDGKKMSKRLKNYPDPTEVIEKYGADSIRYYLMSSPVVHAENLNFVEKDVHEVQKKFINIMGNVLAFYELYKEHDDGRAPKGEQVLDQWILARLNQTLEQQTQAMDTYDLATGARVLQGFVTDLSTWYVRRSRERIKTEGEDQKEALATLRTVLETFSLMMAPVMPFLAERLYQGVKGGFSGEEDRLSVHLEDWPEVQSYDVSILEQMGEARAIVRRILDAREEAGRPVKQVLESVEIIVPSGSLREGMEEIVLEEVNVKSALIQSGDLSIKLNTELTEALQHEGIVRELTRRINNARKKTGKSIEDRIELMVFTEDEALKIALEEQKEVLKKGVLAVSVEIQIPEGGYIEEFRMYEKDVSFGF